MTEEELLQGCLKNDATAQQNEDGKGAGEAQKKKKRKVGGGIETESG